MTVKPITVLLNAAKDGDSSAMDQVYSAAYQELKKLALAHRRRWRGNNTLNATALISEVFIKLAGDKEPDFANRTHFFATASRAMRQVLVNYAEQQRATKRGGDAVRITLDEEKLAGDTTVEELLDLHETVARLETENPRRCQIVECRIFGGMTIDEVAEALVDLAGNRKARVAGRVGTHLPGAGKELSRIDPGFCMTVYSALLERMESDAWTNRLRNGRSKYFSRPVVLSRWRVTSS